VCSASTKVPFHLMYLCKMFCVGSSVEGDRPCSVKTWVLVPSLLFSSCVILRIHFGLVICMMGMMSPLLLGGCEDQRGDV
jgi:hypothetical protein